ncbi:MAG: transcriptional repressor [Rickettsiales bacterium]|nr:transcriptional repressor [Rickettsiales bacterium]
MQARNTKQKQAIAQAIHDGHRPLTAQEVLTLAQKHIPTLGIATVYRELARLQEAGDIHLVSIAGDPPRYEAANHHHHHFKCTSCSHVFELEGCLKDIIRLTPRGFTHQSHDLTLYGQCSACA